MSLPPLFFMCMCVHFFYPLLFYQFRSYIKVVGLVHGENKVFNC